MADKGLVDGDGWISDESDFYGNERLRAKLERRARRPLKRPAKTQFTTLVAKRVKLAFDYTAPHKTTAETAQPGEQLKHDVLSFLKSRPQIASMQKGRVKHLNPAKVEPVRNVKGEEAEDLVEDDRFKGDMSAWQHDESITAFLRRAPVADSTTTSLGPWLWVSNPKISYHHRKQEQKTNVSAFKEGGVQLLDGFESMRAKIEAANEDKAPGTITRYLRPYREQLEDDLLQLAVKTGTTCGKWMLFPMPDNLARAWRLVAEATSQGKLGPTSKVATHDPYDPKPERVICVYTHDFSDTEDVRRVLVELLDIDLVSRDGRAIFYKCDAYTYLSLNSDNRYKIKASLYSSKEILDKSAKAKQDGPIVRLKKKSAIIDSFVSA